MERVENKDLIIDGTHEIRNKNVLKNISEDVISQVLKIFPKGASNQISSFSNDTKDN